jgi:hypothetical protein
VDDESSSEKFFALAIFSILPDFRIPSCKSHLSVIEYVCAICIWLLELLSTPQGGSPLQEYITAAGAELL